MNPFAIAKYTLYLKLCQLCVILSGQWVSQAIKSVHLLISTINTNRVWWPDLAIFWTLGNFLKGVKITLLMHFIIFPRPWSESEAPTQLVRIFWPSKRTLPSSSTVAKISKKKTRNSESFSVVTEPRSTFPFRPLRQVCSRHSHQVDRAILQLIIVTLEQKVPYLDKVLLY